MLRRGKANRRRTAAYWRTLGRDEPPSVAWDSGGYAWTGVLSSRARVYATGAAMGRCDGGCSCEDQSESGGEESVGPCGRNPDESARSANATIFRGPRRRPMSRRGARRVGPHDAGGCLGREIPAGTHQVRLEFGYDGGGLAKGGTVSLFIDVPALLSRPIMLSAAVVRGCLQLCRGAVTRRNTRTYAATGS